MVQNVTNFFTNTTFQNAYIIEDGYGEARDIIFMSDKAISLNLIRLKSTLVLNSDQDLQN